jgi:glycosyltransferase involved in cell wall biosynthesis
MLSYSFYESDNRVRRYAETLAKDKADVDVISLRRGDQEKHENINGVNVYRIQKRTRNEVSKFSYLQRLIKFFIVSTLFISNRHFKKHYDLVHVHNIPDFMVLAALLPKLTGSKIILDIHDLLPEFYKSKFNTNENSFSYRLLLFFEKLSASFADHVIISNHLWQNSYAARSVKAEKTTVIMNYPDENIFSSPATSHFHEKFVIIYPGTLNWHQGLDIAINAFAIIKDEVPHAEFHIYGEGPSKSDLIRQAKQLGLEKRVLFKDTLPIDQIAVMMKRADFGVVPKRANSFGNEAFSTKILEFMSLGVPVIVSNTKIDTFYFIDSVVMFFRNEDVNDLANKMLLMIKDNDLRSKYISNSSHFIKEYKWSMKKYIYLDLVSSLVNKDGKILSADDRK